MKKISKGLLQLCAVLLSIAFCVNVCALFQVNTPLYQILTSIGLLVTSLFGAIYVFTGYTKEKSARYFTIFMFLYAFTEWFGIIGAKSVATANMMLLVLSFGCAFVLAIAKDLGKTKSVILSGTIIITVIGRLIISALTTGLPVFGVRPFTKLLLGIVVMVLVLAKYEDKSERGTK